MNAERRARPGQPVTRSGVLAWLLPPVIGLVIVLGWQLVQGGGLGLEALVATALFALLATAVWVLGRRYEARRSRDQRETER